MGDHTLSKALALQEAILGSTPSIACGPRALLEAILENQEQALRTSRSAPTPQESKDRPWENKFN